MNCYAAHLLMYKAKGRPPGPNRLGTSGSGQLADGRNNYPALRAGIIRSALRHLA